LWQQKSFRGGPKSQEKKWPTKGLAFKGGKKSGYGPIQKVGEYKNINEQGKKKKKKKKLKNPTREILNSLPSPKTEQT